jgi:hypothetical protein
MFVLDGNRSFASEGPAALADVDAKLYGNSRVTNFAL